jgi:hypothetical protein
MDNFGASHLTILRGGMLAFLFVKNVGLNIHQIH